MQRVENIQIQRSIVSSIGQIQISEFNKRKKLKWIKNATEPNRIQVNMEKIKQ